MNRVVRNFVILAVFFLFMVIWAMLSGHAATTSKHHTNGLGVVQYQTNPLTYLEGSITNVAMVGDGVNLRIQPRSTYGLFTQELLLCNVEHVVDVFHGKGGLVVMTYETVSHRTIEGVGCHNLVAVDMIVPERPNE